MDDSIRSNNSATNQSNAGLKQTPAFDQNGQLYSFYNQAQYSNLLASNSTQNFQYTQQQQPQHQAQQTPQFNYMNIQPQQQPINYLNYQQFQQQQQMYQNAVNQYSNYQNISFLNSSNSIQSPMPNIYYQQNPFLLNQQQHQQQQPNIYQNYYSSQPAIQLDLNQTQNSANNSSQKSPKTQYQPYIAFIQSPKKKTSNFDDHSQSQTHEADTSSFLGDTNESSIYSNSSKRSSAAAVLPIPKYIKPKICKSPLVIQSVSSKRVVKPKPEIATAPPEQFGTQYQMSDHFPKVSEYVKMQLRQQPPPPPPQPPPPPPSFDTFSIPPRPASPPTQPPVVQRPSIFSNQKNVPPPSGLPPPPPNVPPPIPYHSKASNKQNLLNQILNNSLNSDKQNPKNYEYESSFNNSASSTHNNSVFNNTGPTNTNTDENLINYHQLLMSPNLYTFFDRKKQPPPPYPGKILTNTVVTEQPDLPVQQEQSVEQQPKSNGSSNSSFLSTTSTVRTCSPQAFKFFMEQHAENVLKHHKAREFRRLQLENEMQKVGLPADVKDQMRKLLRQKETNYLRLRRAKMNKSMFEQIKTLGIGAFGQVDLVRKKDDPSRLYAMKMLHKSDVFNRNQAAHVKAERDILAEADNEWVVKLYYSFQDDENLYFVMDYVPGGDLMNLLIKKQIFSEKLAQFYIGELTCAIESVHSLGFIHRDIKPDNILIDRKGHIKLTDFGLCTGFHWTHNSQNYIIDDTYNRILDKKINKTNASSTDRRLMAHSLVGTPNYIAPEILSRKGYTKSCDWWSVGVIFYEMTVGEPPFRDETALGTQSKVINWRNTLRVPDVARLSNEAKDLIYKLCTDAETRLGGDGIKSHSFFKGFDFGPNLRRSDAPYKPSIKHPTDTSNFEPIDTSILADRKARIDEMNRIKQQQNLNSNNQSNSNFRKDFSDLNNSQNSNCNNSMNPILYEFTFRRFFDDTYSSDNRAVNGYSNENELENDNDHSNSIKSFMKSISANNQLLNKSDNVENMDFNTDLSLEKHLSPTLTTMMASVTTSCKTNQPQFINDENSLSYQTDKLIDHTKKIQLKESTNFNGYTMMANENNLTSESTMEPNSKESSNKPPIYI